MVTPRRRGEAGPVPSLGRPIGGLRVHLLDRSLRPVPPGTVGELLVGGPALARGYVADPARTAERFLPDPWGAGERLYRTGDLCRFRRDGEIEIVGRADHQVKIRGQRIEPGEIEAALAALPDVREAVVVAREGRLVAYVTGGAKVDALRAALRERLPDFMVPAVFVTLDVLPLTPNGKVDRQALSSMGAAPEPPGAAETYQAPRTPVEEVVAGIWAELLGLDRVGVDGDFFALGGHSLLAARVTSRLRQAFGVELPVRDLFEAPTVAALAARIEAARRTGATSSAPPLVPAPRGGDLPLSFAQQRLWLIDQLEPGTPLYNLPLVLRAEGPLRAAVLRRALSEIVRRHEAVRTVFASREDAPAQVILPPAPFSLPLVDLSALPEPAREAAALALAGEEAVRPFDLRRDPMLRGVLLRLGEEDHAVALTMHHVASDGWSLGLLVREVSALYAAFAEGRPSPLPELPVQYADFALWQRSWLRGELLEDEIAWWRQQLAGLPPVLELPADRPRPAAQSYRGATRPVRLPAGLAGRLEALGRREGATLFMVLLAGVQALLARWSGQEDMAVGSPVAGRGRIETEELIGFFVNTLVLRGDLAGGPTFRELLGRARETALAAYLHQDVPFEKLVEALAPERSLAHTPLFQVMLVLQNAPGEDLEIPGLRLSPVAVDAAPAKLDLTLNLGEHEGRVAGTAVYATDLFDAATIERLLIRFERLLEAAMADPDRPLAELPLLTAAELHQARREWHPAVSIGGIGGIGLRVHERFAAQTERTPDAIALVYQGQSITARELDRRANQLARHLRKRGVGPEVPVGIFLERTPELVLAILAVLKAGGVYVPFDTTYPEDRLAYLLEDSGAHLLLTEEALRPLLPERMPPLVRIVRMGADWDEIGRESETGFDSGAGPDHLAYVIYTSGSTGRPKGVGVSHGNLTSYVDSVAAELSVPPHCSYLMISTIAADGGNTALFLSLCTGGCLHVLPRETSLDPRAVAEYVESHPIDFFKIVVSHFAMLFSSPFGARLLPRRWLILGGEALGWDLVDAIRALRPECEIYDHYGPTETTVGVLMNRIDREGEGRSRPPMVPPGRPLANSGMRILDRHQQPAPVGVIGELYVGGPCVARGYLRRPDLTAERFVPADSGARLYRTGDLVRYLPDGRIEFLGRADHQIKVRGFRIELGEIEAALAALDGVRDALVMLREDIPGDPRLVAYVVGEAAPEALRAGLRDRLPDYMVPAAFVMLPAFPLIANGKVDRRALPAPEHQRAEGSYQAPRTPAEEVLAGLWAELLGLERAGADDDFFELGGHSLLATRVMSRLRGAFGVELPLRDLFEAPTPAGLAARIEAARRAGAGLLAPPLVPVPREGPLPLSFAQQRLWFVDQLEPDSALYNLPVALRADGPLDPAVLARVLSEIVRRHEALRTVFAAVNGAPAQVIQPAAPFHLPVVDLGGLPERRREAAALALAGDEALRPFDLRRGPLLRCVLLRLGEGAHVAALTLHHIASDGWSGGILVREIAALYPELAEGRPSPLPELPVQYADFAVWQRSWLRGEVLEDGISFWRRQLAGLPPLLELPTDRPRPAIRSDRGATRRMSLNAGISRRIEALARSEGATLFMVLLAAFQTLLARYSGQDDLAVGTSIAGRNREETEGLIGLFINTLVLRGDLAGSPTFREVLHRSRETALAAYLHQDVPFERLVDELAPERNLAHTPLFQVLLVLQNVPVESLEVRDLRLRPVGETRRLAQLDLSLTLMEHGGGLIGEAEYATELFDAPTVDRFAAHFERLLAAAITEPDLPAFDLPLASAAESAQILHEWNDTRVEAFTAACLHREVAAVAARTPSAVAVEMGDERWTYRRLVGSARRLARHLRTLGVGPDVVVGLCAERSPLMVVGMLAVLEAGGAWLPLDPVHPPERLAFLLADGGARVLVSQESLLGRVPDAGLPTVILDARWDAGEEMGEDLGVEVSPDHLAYVIYTSGSTGQPKGVMVPHRGVCNRLWSAVAANRIDERDAFLQKASFGFDVSVWECFTPLLAGARLVQTAPGREGDGPYLVRLIREHRVTLVDFVPAMLAAFLDEEDVESCATVRQIFVGGEALAPELRDRALARLKVPLDNLCGPTEVTIDTTRWVCLPGQEHHRVPLGRPIANSLLYVADPEMRLLPVGVAGELLVGGVGVTRGYVGRPDLTAERYIPDPFGGQPGARLYRSGDLVRWLPDGALDILGRLDHQVKVRGFRVELGEIESTLAALPGVQQAAVLVREDRSARKRVVAYVAGDATADELRRSLRDRLPEYMVPSAFVKLASLPLTTNGKVDRKALPEPEEAGADESYVAPRTREEEILAEVWAQVLRLPRVGVEDNFFELGGDSILSVQIAARARQAGLHITVRQIFEHQTIAGLALHATAAGGAVRAGQGPVAGEVPLTPIQRWFLEQGFAEPHHFNQALLLEPAEPLDPAALERALAAIVEHHDALRMRLDLQTGRQENAAAEPVTPFHRVDLFGLPTSRRGEALESATAAVQAGFDPAAGPLTRLCLLDAGAGQRLLWATHHLVVDGVSWRVLLEDLEGAYRQAARGLPVSLPPKTTSFQEWARRLAAHAGSEALARELDFWRETARIAVPRLPVDLSDGGTPEDTVADEATVSFALDPEETADLLQTLPAVYQSRVEEALLSSLARALAGWTGSPRLRVELEGHGREPIFDDLDVSRTVGWFTSQYPVVLEAGDAGPEDALRSARERLRAVPERGIGYGLLRYIGDAGDAGDALAAAPAVEISFNYLGQVDATFGGDALLRPAAESAGPSRSPRARRTHRLEIGGIVADGRLRISLTYGARTHRRETVERLAAAYAGALRELIQHGRAAAPVPRLAEEGDTWSPLVPIQPLGARTPLFCVHPLGGEVLTYYRLARELGAGQPVYGLQAHPRDGQAGMPRPTIEERAAGYVEAVRGLQPAGPYLLAGYSFGAIVAFEMARQLTLAGEEVALLALLDQAVTPGDEAAEIDTASVIVDMVRHQARDQGPGPVLTADALRGLPVEEQLARGLEVLGSQEALGAGFDIPMLRDLALGWSARTTAAERYKPSPYPGRITLLRASAADPAALRELPPERRRVFADPTLGWGAVAAGGVEVHAVPGSHMTILDADHVETLARTLAACIARAGRGPEEHQESPQVLVSARDDR
ncbi:MAG TPA: amino acid adenylation domain-containing protein [Thermoanaerobaculia bacterium]